MLNPDGIVVAETQYQGIKVTPTTAFNNTLVATTTDKGKQYVGRSFPFLNLDEAGEFKVVAYERWHIGSDCFTRETAFPIHVVDKLANDPAKRDAERLSQTGWGWFAKGSNIKQAYEKPVPNETTIGKQSIMMPFHPLNDAIRIDIINKVAYLLVITSASNVSQNAKLISNTNDEYLHKKELVTKFGEKSLFNEEFIAANLKYHNKLVKHEIVQYNYDPNTTIRLLSPYEVIALKKYHLSIVINLNPVSDLISVSSRTNEVQQISLGIIFG